jgi:chaperone modulatory protein CbpM
MTLREEQVVASVGRISVTELRLWQVQGWVAPRQDDEGPVFDALDVARIRLVCELRQDMEIDEETIPVLLSMVDQIHGLRRSLKSLAQAVDEQPAEVRRSVLTSFQTRLQSKP